MSKLATDGKISLSLTDEFSHVSVSRRTLDEVELNRLHKESRLGTTLRTLASKNDKVHRCGGTAARFCLTEVLGILFNYLIGGVVKYIGFVICDDFFMPQLECKVLGLSKLNEAFLGEARAR